MPLRGVWNMFMKKKPLSTNSTTVCLLCFKPICMVLTFPIIFDGLLYRFDRGCAYWFWQSGCSQNWSRVVSSQHMSGGQVIVQVHAKDKWKQNHNTQEWASWKSFKSVMPVEDFSSLNKAHNNSEAPFLVQSALRHKFEQVGRRWKNVAGSWLLILGEPRLLLNSTSPPATIMAK